MGDIFNGYLVDARIEGIKTIAEKGGNIGHAVKSFGRAGIVGRIRGFVSGKALRVDGEKA